MPARDQGKQRDPEADPPEQKDEQDEAVAESFPASDPPASTGIIGPRRKPGRGSRDAK